MMTVRLIIILCALTASAQTSKAQEVRLPPPNNEFPQWSHDGKKIAFTSDRDGDGELYVMDVDGGNVRRLTNTRATEHGGAWSPDGRKIIFTAEEDDRSEIYVTNADGSDLTALSVAAR